MISLLLTLVVYFLILGLLYWAVIGVLGLLDVATPKAILVVKIIFAIIAVIMLIGIFFEGVVPIHRLDWVK
jgi:hypothetical protein